MLNITLSAAAGDITAFEADAIVSAADPLLSGAHGVSYLLNQTGGTSVRQACKSIVQQQGPLKPGQAVITTAGNLFARQLIHVVGPLWQGGNHNEAEALTACYQNALQLANEHKCMKVLFPAISTGGNGYPPHLAAQVAVNAILNFGNKKALGMFVTLVCIERPNLEAVYTLVHQHNMRLYSSPINII